jgi:hypothetical protein
VFVERHLASGERFLAEPHWDLRGVSQTMVTQLLRQLAGRLLLWEARLAAVDPMLIPQMRGKIPGVQTWHAQSGAPARGESLVGHHWGLIGLVSTWGAAYLCWPVWARLLPGQLNPLGCVAGPDGVQRLDFWLGVVGREGWLRDVTQTVRVVVIATKGEPILLVSTDVTRPPTGIIQLYAARFPMELALRDAKQYLGFGDYQCQSLLAIHRFVHLALTASWWSPHPARTFRKPRSVMRSSFAAPRAMHTCS